VRSSSIVLLIASILPLTVIARAVEPLSLSVTLHQDTYHTFPSHTYGLLIANQMDHSVTIELGILVERQTPSGWQLSRGIQAVSTCDRWELNASENAPVRIEPHGTLTVVPWDGWDCKGQCLTACQQNVPPMSGTYRFVVMIVPTGQRVISPIFEIEPRSISIAH
jgi:hypothetical protein